eukprot:scaffold1058_cov155-Ochromonas_danica.AAC.30
MTAQKQTIANNLRFAITYDVVIHFRLPDFSNVAGQIWISGDLQPSSPRTLSTAPPDTQEHADSIRAHSRDSRDRETERQRDSQNKSLNCLPISLLNGLESEAN